MDNISVCKICKEPIWNFICINCLGNDIRRLLPDELSEKFSKFHENFLRYFHSDYDELISCLKCKLSDAPPICIDCYLNEIFTHFRHANDSVIKSIRKKFQFDFEKHERIMREHETLSITEDRPPARRSGICDDCGEYSEGLKKSNGLWLCEDCTEKYE